MLKVLDKETGTSVNTQIQYKLIEKLVAQNKEKDNKTAELAKIKAELEQQIACLNEAAIVSESDYEGNIMFVNDKFCEISGYKRAELIGENHSILRSGVHSDSFHNNLWEVIRSGNVWKGKVKSNKKGGKEFYWTDTTILPFKDLNGKIIKYVGIRFDITAEVEQKETLLGLAEELHQFIETTNAPIFGINKDGLVNEWNHTSEIITGFKKEEVLGKSVVATYISTKHQKSLKKVLDDALLGKETASYEFPLLTKEGKRIMILLNSSARRDADGKIIGVLGVGQDITGLVGYRNELKLKVDQRTLKLNLALKKEKELSELKSKFVSIASHEFRTPLSTILFAAGAVKKYFDKMDPAIIVKKLSAIEDQVSHMKRLIEDVLVIGQAESGRLKNVPLYLNVGDFMCKIIEEVHSSSNNSHEIVLIDKEDLKNSDIFIDEKLARHIFINLITNGIKFSPDAKEITIEFSSEKGNIIISVTDYGIGISKLDLENIFKPFTRGENAYLIQGTGLGLSIVKESLDLMKGEITVLSTLGSGTKFTVKIPKT